MLLMIKELLKALLSMLFSPSRMLGRGWLSELITRTIRGLFDTAYHQSWGWMRSALANIELPSPYFSKVHFSNKSIAGIPCLLVMDKNNFDLSKTQPESVETVIIYLHGGGYVVGSPNTSHKALVAGLAATNKNTLIIAPDYRLAPEYPFPQPQNDCVNVVQACLAQYPTSKVIVAGDSAGGGLAIDTARQLSLAAQRESKSSGIAGLVLLSPWVDPLAKGGSMTQNQANDYLTLPFLHKSFDALMQGANPNHERVNFTQTDLSMLPKTLVQSGTGELFFDQIQDFNARISHQGVDCTVQNFKAQFHVFQLYSPILKQARIAMDNIAQFIESV